MNNEDLIHKFYTAFAAQDAETMASCYHEEVIFEDPAFGELQGEEVKDMWRMLIQRAKGNLVVEYSDVAANGEKGSAAWQATYNYGKSKRKVVNRIKAQFVFKDGLIKEHKDSFDVWKWSRMALGIPGTLLGWTPFMQKKIQQGARESLANWKSKNR